MVDPGLVDGVNLPDDVDAVNIEWGSSPSVRPHLDLTRTPG